MTRNSRRAAPRPGAARVVAGVGPPTVGPPRVPPAAPVDRGAPLGGAWLFTTRPGAEGDLVEELTLALGTGRAWREGPSCVRSRGAPTTPGGAIDLTFARQGFRIVTEITACDDGMAAALVRAIVGLSPLARDGEEVFYWSLWAPDSERTLPLAARAKALEGEVLRRLVAEHPALAARCRAAPCRGSGTLVEGAMLARDRIVLGLVPGPLALSLAPAGRARMRVGRDRPSRSARKVEEALAWLGVEPGPGDVCVDLGAAPGGWSWSLLARRARVQAVDPARLRPDLLGHRSLEHHRVSAVDFEPARPVDWLFCDMAWRPLEVAALLAKWGRRRWASLLVANLKLPMRRKAEMVARLRGVVASGGWRDVRTRQLYHDRAEVTLTAHR